MSGASVGKRTMRIMLDDVDVEKPEILKPYEFLAIYG
jgi:hypothetical protein